MTREEFIDYVDTYEDLQEFCGRNGLNSLDGIYDNDSWCDYINDNLVNMAENRTWRDLLETLRNYEENDGYEFYVWDDYYDRFDPIDYDDIKERVLEDADYAEVWDSEDEPDDVDTLLTDEKMGIEEEIESDGCPMEEMLAESRNYVQSFTDRELQAIGDGLRSVRTMVE